MLEERLDAQAELARLQIGLAPKAEKSVVEGGIQKPRVVKLRLTAGQ